MSPSEAGKKKIENVQPYSKTQRRRNSMHFTLYAGRFTLFLGPLMLYVGCAILQYTAVYCSRDGAGQTLYVERNEVVLYVGLYLYVGHTTEAGAADTLVSWIRGGGGAPRPPLSFLTLQTQESPGISNP